MMKYIRRQPIQRKTTTAVTRRRLVVLLPCLVAVFSLSCRNFDNDYDNFDYTAGFFPYQYPVRTLVLGDYIYDNSNDNAHKFVISVAMGGVYRNDHAREFTFQVDESLCENLFFQAGGDPVLPLPSDYYTLSSDSKIVIPAGKMNGGVEVQLTDAFFDDPLAISRNYAVPLRLVNSADVDTILSGRSTLPNPNLVNEADWTVLPKNYTVFAVKYINEFHGTYFHYGSSSVKDAAGEVVETATYSEKYVEYNPVEKLITTGRHQVSLNIYLESEIVTGEAGLLLDFSGDNCTVTGVPGSAYTISGSGEFKSKAYTWGNKKRDGITLHIMVSDGNNTYEANDVLVARDRGVVMEVFSPVVSTP